MQDRGDDRFNYNDTNAHTNKSYSEITKKHERALTNLVLAACKESGKSAAGLSVNRSNQTEANRNRATLADQDLTALVETGLN